MVSQLLRGMIGDMDTTQECDSCKLPFKSAETGCELCLTCLKVLRCMTFMKAHRLCGCGDDWCVHNTSDRHAKADKLKRLAAHQIPA